MTSTTSLNWNASFTVSVAIHAAIIGLIAMHSLISVSPVGGSESLTIVALGGPAGASGGLGDIQKEGREGNAGNGGDGAKHRAKERERSDAEGKPRNNAEEVKKAAVSEPPVEKKLKPKPEATPSLKARESAQPREKEPVRVAEKKPPARTSDQNGQREKVDVGSGGMAGASGTAGATAKTEGSGVGNRAGDLSGNDQFTANGDGTWTAQGASGISYTILTDATTKYPQEARAIGFNKVVKVKVRFLVGLDGGVEAVEILNTDIPNLGFREASLTAIKAMRFEPVWYKGNNIKVYFRKTIVFQP